MIAQPIVVRPSTEADVPRLTEIYAHHVLNGPASFELEPPDAAEMAQRRRGILDAGLPHIVAERDGRVLGYAYAGAYRPRRAYRFAVEDSIYIDAAATGQGVGKILLPALIERCEALGKRQLVAVIGGGYEPSVKLHAAFGFAHVGRVPAVGWKFGKWLDQVIMIRTLGEGASSPPRD